MNQVESTIYLRKQNFKVPPELPWNSEAVMRGILERLDTLRFTYFLTLQAELLTLHTDECISSNFLAHATDVACLAANERRQIISHPAFRAWTALTLLAINQIFLGKNSERHSLADLLLAFPEAIDRIRTDLAKDYHPTFFRLDLDPLLARTLPPSYEIPADEAAIATAKLAGHPLGFFRDVALLGIERIHKCWPFAGRLVDQLVGNIAYLPDGNFRSCSASRYTGLVLLSARDGSVLDLEESLVHEAGHQLLYAMVEIAPVCSQTADGTYKLPWSTQVRDVYGYFHATFIYVILARYMERVVEQRTGDEARRAGDRLRQIVSGLVVAIPDLLSVIHLTREGRILLLQLSTEVDAIANRHRVILG